VRLWKGGERYVENIRILQGELQMLETHLWTATAALGALLVYILGADEAATTVWPPRTAGRNALANDLIVKDVY
jgi:hypothetical protein